MNAYRLLTVGVLVVVASMSISQGAPPPGPPWPVNFPPAKQRPATDAPKQDFAVAEVEASGGPIGVAVTVTAAVAKPKAGSKYDLYHQFRVHTRKGEAGPLLGTKASPEGQPFVLKQVVCEYDWIEFYEKFDVTRRDLSGMINLPSREQGGSDKQVMIRVEPQIYDVAEKKYITPYKTPAAILVASVGLEGKVWRLESLASWLIGKARDGNAKAALDALADLDDFSIEGNRVDDAFFTVLSATDVSVETKALFVAAVPAALLQTKNGFNLKVRLEQFAAGDEAVLKAAAQKKLAEVK